jgi:two-component system phosphate regulon sensor histidine kinase PhoR
MHPGLWREVWILAGIAAASVVFGAFTGRPFVIAAIGFSLYIVVHLRHLRHLHRWLQEHRAGDIPDAGGLWGEVFDELYRSTKEARRREALLSEMLTRFQSAASAMPDAVAIISREGEIEWANPAAGRLLGIRYPQDAGMRLLNLLRDPDFAHYLQSGEYAEPIEIESPENQQTHLSVQITPFGSRQQLLIGRDVTRLVRLEQMRRHFIANVSHELRTPLTVLGGYIETLQQSGKIRPEELRRHLATMQEQSARMQRLVDDLLTLSKLETSPPRTREEMVDVPALLAELNEQAQILSGEKRHAITLQADPGLKLLGSREELTSAFLNLIINAVRYTPAGGTIRLVWRARDGGAEFCVSDTGEGIAPEHLPHLTERFYRVDTARSRASGGTGLGLSIVKHVLLRHEARLEIDSELGRGSTFCCVFPAARTPPAGDRA